MPRPTATQTVPPPYPRYLAVIILLCMGCAFAGNHVAARVAFDDGAGVLLAILLQALRQAMPQNQSVIAALAERFGNVWLVLMLATGMAALIGLDMIFRLVDSAPEQALALYHSRNLITEALGGGIELVGGLWVLLLSIAGLQQQRFARPLHLLGLLVGSLGILTVLHTLPYLKEAFGLLQLIWFIWLGMVLLTTAGDKRNGPGLNQPVC